MRKVFLAAAVATLGVFMLPETGGALSIAAPALSISAQPSALPPGNDFQVRGFCASDVPTSVTVRLVRQARPGVAESVVATKTTKTSVDENNRNTFSVTFHNNLVPPAGFPIDAKLFAVCNGYTAEAPFVSTQLAYPHNRQTILTAQASLRCAGCPPHLKGFDAFGNVANNNHIFKSNWTSIGSIVNLSYNSGNEDYPPDDRVFTTATLASGPGMPVALSNISYDEAGHAFGNFSGGASVARGDLNGDGNKEILVAAGPGGGPHVKFYWYQKDDRPWTGLPFEEGGFYAYPTDFAGGVRVAFGDVIGDAKPEIITAPGPGGGPHIKVFDTDGHLLTQFFAYAPTMTGGVSISVGDVVPGGKKEIVTGAGPGGAPHVRTFTGDGTPIGNGFYAYAESFTGGVNVSVGDVDHQGGADIVTGAGPGGMPHVRWFTSPDGAFTTPGFYAYENIPTGVIVAAESS